MRGIKLVLREWGDFHIRHMDHSDEYGQNILHRAAEYGYTDPQPGTDKILCPDMPRHIQKTDLRVKRLSGLLLACVTLFYCAPCKPDGTVYTKSELARMLGINKGKFRAELRKGERKLSQMRG